MPSLPTKVLSLAIFATLSYAFHIHYPQPRKASTTTTEESSPPPPPPQPALPSEFTTNRRFSIAVFLLAFPTILLNPVSPPPLSSSSLPLEKLLDAIALVLLAAGHALFIWAAYTTKPGRLNLIFSPTKLKLVVDGGPFAYIRHPTYTAYSLIFVGIWLAVVSVSAGHRVLSLFEGAKLLAVAICVVGIVGGYRQGAIMEEGWFLRGADVEEGVREAYVRYVGRVKYRWVPGVA